MKNFGSVAWDKISYQEKKKKNFNAIVHFWGVGFLGFYMAVLDKSIFMDFLSTK